MKNAFRKYLLYGFAAALALWFSGAATAQEEKPFADQKFVLQISDMDPDKQTLVLNVASNIIKYYGPDRADVEIVAFGPGLSLLYPDNPQRERVASLVAADVRFVGCLNTVATIERKTGKKPELVPETVPVQTGVAHLVERATQGYVVVRP